MPDREHPPEAERMITPVSTDTSTDARRRRAQRQALPQDDVPFTAGARSTPERVDRAVELARVCARIADENRAREILLLDLRNVTPLVDFFVIATAASRRQSHAIAEEIDQEMKRRSERKLGIEGSEEGRWVLLDYGDFVVHIFSPEARSYYRLEEIWGDAPQLDWQDPAIVRLGPSPEPSSPSPSAPKLDEPSEPGSAS
jgi:ribosome-associated protein